MHSLRKSMHGRKLEHLRQRHSISKSLRQLRVNLGEEQRVPPKFEKVVVNSDRFNS